MTKVDLTFTAPTLPVSINRWKSMHWAQRQRVVKPWKDMAWVTCRNHLNRQKAVRAARGWRRSAIAPPPVPVTIQVVLPFRTANRRDPHNYTGTNVKAVVDGLVLAGLVPDDTAEWVTVLDPEVLVIRDKSEPLTATIRVRPRETP